MMPKKFFEIFFFFWGGGGGETGFFRLFRKRRPDKCIKIKNNEICSHRIFCINLSLETKGSGKS